MRVVVIRVVGTSYTLSLAAVGNFPCRGILPKSVNGRIAAGMWNALSPWKFKGFCILTSN